MARPIPILLLLTLLTLLAACGRRHDGAGEAPSAMLANLSDAPPAGATMAPVDDGPQDTSDPIRFQPLRSAAVKDAIHRALSTGETQRWADGALTGYAVPGGADARGCRMVRYTVDQRTGAAPESITACDAH